MEQSNFQFALPTIGTSEMSRNDQGALIVNQATAAIVTSYLEYARHNYAVARNNGAGSAAEILEPYIIESSDLTTLINNVQTALKSF